MRLMRRKLRPHTRESLARNVKYLMDTDQGFKKHDPDATRWTQELVAKVAGVAQRTVSNILKPDSHCPMLDSIDDTENLIVLVWLLSPRVLI